MLPALLAGWYLLLASNGTLSLLRAISAPREGHPAGDFPCASHGCACLTLEQCRQRCCCFRGGKARGEAGAGHGESAREGSRTIARLIPDCAGHSEEEAAGGLKQVEPHLVVSPSSVLLPPFAGRSDSRRDQPLASLPADPPEKVPI
jgi:hypothetical protein